MADPVAIQDEIAVIEKRIEELQTQLKDAKARLLKSQEESLASGPGAHLSEEEKLALIKVNLQEVLNPEIMEAALKKQGHLKVYWGTATTGRPHCGYFVPILKIAQFLAAGCHVKILLADIHGFLDNLKAPIELVKFRAEYYRFTITALLRAVNVPIDKLEFVLGSSYELNADYTMDLLRLASITSERDAKKAGAEVVKQTENAPLSGLLYPLMQALDEQYLDVDVQFGGVDQRKIFALAKEVLPKIGYKERAHLMNPMVPGLQGGKMSASDPDSKIDVLDDKDAVKRKLKKAFAPPKIVEENGVLSFVEYVLLPAGHLIYGESKFVVNRRDAEPLVYTNIKQMQDDYVNDILIPQDLKPAVTEALNKLLEPVQAEFQASAEWKEIETKAYPPPPAEKKKEKKKKDKGTFHPGKKVEAKPDGHVEGEDKAAVDVGSASGEKAIENLTLKE
ncbi:Nucleotidylyl transferase [Cucurbitaria berberidis CBS 394.84]|uniref:Tyrosine--tRNA ligase n=1 Tax=Cucurbitaria berberidis CBS 394.84 TaxID=1168544 RepID=A0A9P4LBJ5_9PLEO|nr:Nucleotidylyl transferase [Cucurbitaria berberidis CBS 394.84]KAF1848254.1 Nucleotidylyl transferase [Cucurbitaria berberidis CBS 394.84]